MKQTDEHTGICADSTAIQTPDDLAAAGYRIELGPAHDLAPWLRGKYWWTWHKPGYGHDASHDEHDTAEGAIESARKDMKEWEGVPFARQGGPR